jgi:predicted RNase H-like HicB family nuclease
MLNYSVEAIWSEEDECYIATIPEFPGLSAFGDTQEKAIKEAKIALKGFIKVYKEDGCDLPKPYILEPFSGQTRLRLPKSLHASLAKEAKREGVSLNTYILSILSERHYARTIEHELSEIKNLFSSHFQVVQGNAWVHGIIIEPEGSQFDAYITTTSSNVGQIEYKTNACDQMENSKITLQ